MRAGQRVQSVFGPGCVPRASVLVVPSAMPDPPPSPAQPDDSDQSAKLPFSTPQGEIFDPANAPPPSPKVSGGCIMIMVVVFWLLALGLWMLWHLMGQVKEMRSFTDPTAQAIQPTAPSGEEKAALQSRMKAFAAAINAKQQAKLELSAADLNHLIAAQEPVSRLQDIAKVEEITDLIRVKVALALNGIPFSGERMYLNGFINVRPEVKKDTGVVLLTRSLEVPGRSLTPGFTKTYLDANHLDGLAMDEVRKDATLKATLAKITSIRCEPGKVVVEFLP